MINVRGMETREDATSDKAVRDWLLQNAPYAYNNAQRIVTVANKCAKPPGLFSNPVRHLPDLEEACEALLVAIEHHDLRDDSGLRMSPSNFMSIFSEAHPNWRNAYNYLNRHSPYFQSPASTSDKQLKKCSACRKIRRIDLLAKADGKYFCTAGCDMRCKECGSREVEKVIITDYFCKYCR